MQSQAKYICCRAFEVDPHTQSKEKLQNLDVLSKNLFKVWCNWQKKCVVNNVKQSEIVVNLVLVTSLMIQLCVSCLLKNTNRLWWILGLCEQFFDFLLKENLRGLVHLIEDLLADRPPVVI